MKSWLTIFFCFLASSALAQSSSSACEERIGNCRGCLTYADAIGQKPCYWCKLNSTVNAGLCSDDFNSDQATTICPGGKPMVTAQIADCVEVTTESLIIAVVGGVVGAAALVGCYYYYRQQQQSDPFSKSMKEENMRRKARELQADHDNKHREFKVVRDRNGNQRLVIVDHDEEISPDTGSAQAQGPRWKCSRCTTDNNSASVKCAGCGNKRPGSNGAPQQLREPPPGVELPPGTRLGMDGTVYKEDGWVVIGKLKVVDDEDDYGEGPGEGGYDDNEEYGEGGEY